MLRKSQRLTAAQFTTVFADGAKIHSTLFTAIYDSADESKISVVVSKKLVRSAVGRNRQRRRVYGQLQQLVDQLPRAHIILLAKAPLIDATASDIATDLAQLLGRIQKAR